MSLESIKKDDLIYVKVEDHHPWEMMYFSHWSGHVAMCYRGQLKEKDDPGTKMYFDYSLTNPLLKTA